jgi:hypothetical protein
LSLDVSLLACGILAEAVLVVLLARSRVYKTLPAFFLYVCWCLFNDSAFAVLMHYFPAAFFKIYEIQMVIDSTMIFAVLVELAWSVLRPLRSSLPRRSWIAIPFLIAVAGVLVWPIAGLTHPSAMTPQGAVLFHLMQTFAILRVTVFFAMAGFSQLIGIGWRNRELQVASGLGFYAILSLGVTVLHTHQLPRSPQYHLADQMVATGYFFALAYWLWSFATKEAERHEFSPQMANFLLLIGGTAKASRVAIADYSVTKSRFKEH